MLNGLNSAMNHQEELSENVNDRGHSIWNSETGPPPTVHGPHTDAQHTHHPWDLSGRPGRAQGPRGPSPGAITMTGASLPSILPALLPSP